MVNSYQPAMNAEPLVSLLSRLTKLGVPPKEMPMWRIHQIAIGEALLVVARNRKCPKCGQPHRLAWAMVRATKTDLKELFKS